MYIQVSYVSISEDKKKKKDNKEKAKEFAGKMTQLQKDLISYWRGRMLIYIVIVLIIILTWIFA